MANTTTSLAPARAEKEPGAGALVGTGRVRRRYSVLTRRDKIYLTLMVGVPLTLELLLIWGPTLASIGFSFTNWSGIGPITAKNFVGFKNYQFLFSGYTLFWPAFTHNLIWLAWLTFIATPVGMFFAVLLDRELRGTRIYQSVFFLPVVLSLVVVGFIWELQYTPTEGFINNAFGLKGDHQQQHQRSQSGRIRLRHRRHPAADLAGAHRRLPFARDEDALMSTLVATASRTVRMAPRRRLRPARAILHAFLIAMVVLWLFPLFWAVYSSLRPISDTIQRGYVSWPSSLSLANYQTVWTEAEIPYYYINTLVIVVPGVILTLLLASMVAFCCTQFSWRFNLIVLMLFTAGNLLPPQVIIVPLYWIYLNTPIAMLGSIDIGQFSFAVFSDNNLLYDQYVGIILIHVVFQTGFATFVLSNYMKTITKEITESALVDGANVLRIWWSVILPLCRPALAAMATLLFTFMYNDFFWALILLSHGNKRPITTALNNLQGEFFVNNNLIAAGALLACIPPILVYILLQKHFVAGLTLGSTKG